MSGDQRHCGADLAAHAGLFVTEACTFGRHVRALPARSAPGGSCSPRCPLPSASTRAARAPRWYPAKRGAPSGYMFRAELSCTMAQARQYMVETVSEGGS